MNTYPFTFDPSRPFIQQAGEWIADVFYDILPEAGLELRDEQIYMAFQLEKAYAEKKTIFAEAGVGTGKTLVYLLYAIAYARYTRKPAIIACADESLIEQLVKPEGDIHKLARYLDLNVDARLGKSPDQYICLNKLDVVRAEPSESDMYRDIYTDLPEFVHYADTMQTFRPYGNRKDYPALDDEQWSKIGWDVFQDCLVCPQRHRCGQTLSRDHYRKATDIIICSHDFYMEHVWTYEARKREGQLPLLPEHSSVVFDEGHLLETAAQNALTYKLKQALFESIVTRLLDGEVRETLAVAVEEVIVQSDMLFEQLARYSKPVPGSDRKDIEWNDKLLAQIARVKQHIDVIEEELVFESGLFTLDDYQLKIVEEHLEMIQLALGLCRQQDQLISWVTGENEDLTLVIMPKQVKEVLGEMVFARKMPVIFSSATLSVEGSFDYIADSLGIEQYLSFSVESPYDYKEQMQAELITDLYNQVEAGSVNDAAGKHLSISTTGMQGVSEQEIRQQTERVIRLIEQSGGRSLLLFSSMQELAAFRRMTEVMGITLPYRMLYEGTAEISHLISEFQQEETSVLCAVTLWEGLDIPGPSLSHVIIWSLPFPPNDPVFASRRQEAADAFHEVDMPYMMLRLRQGIGRLIRSRDDSGRVSIFGRELLQQDVRHAVEQLLP
ncbi:ATP-dependent DNA helicase [Paenibacillus bovis]|uniref:ATP-dependent helicase n=1 Tax=Paenibacillus bovis TaxID=1616788 RepID=A0A172ZGX0_9BACL|nr:ATP-dependent DNA helicase [Paenibacillus bovis]ANF96885.1 ATP-dependent helicase [Paenibacillus bovis]